MIQVYIAAPYSTRDLAISVMQALEAQGFAVTSQWLTGAVEAESDAGARMDLADVARADVLLALNAADWIERGTGGGGRHVEFGYALALGIPVVLLGPRSNVFHHLAEVHVVGAGDLAKTLRAAAADRGGGAGRDRVLGTVAPRAAESDARPPAVRDEEVP